jgi:hypothetical protein
VAIVKKIQDKVKEVQVLSPAQVRFVPIFTNAGWARDDNPS